MAVSPVTGQDAMTRSEEEHQERHPQAAQVEAAGGRSRVTVPANPVRSL